MKEDQGIPGARLVSRGTSLTPEEIAALPTTLDAYGAPMLVIPPVEPERIHVWGRRGAEVVTHFNQDLDEGAALALALKDRGWRMLMHTPGNTYDLGEPLPGTAETPRWRAGLTWLASHGFEAEARACCLAANDYGNREAEADAIRAAREAVQAKLGAGGAAALAAAWEGPGLAASKGGAS